VRFQLILLAMFIALPLLVGSAIRIYSRSVEGRAQVERDLQRTTSLITLRVGSALRAPTR
jgi:ACR3 family arsenite efflux pump ArsB